MLPRLTVIIEIPAWSFRKARLVGDVAREAAFPSDASAGSGGSVAADASLFVTEFWSLLPCPFNYGFAPDRSAADGACQDVIVLGRRLRPGERVVVTPRWSIRFDDGGLPDDKWVARLDGRNLSRLDIVSLGVFFTVYTRLKQARLLLAGRWKAARMTRWGGLERLL